MRTTKVELSYGQIDDICHALLKYEIDLINSDNEEMLEAVHKIREYLQIHLDECFK